MPNTEKFIKLTKAATGGYKESCSQKFHNVHRKTPVLELLLSLPLLKRDSITDVLPLRNF